MWERSRVESGGRRLFEFCYVPHHCACVTRSAFCPPIDETPPCARRPRQLEVPKASPRRFSALFNRLASPGLAFQCWMIIVVHRVVLDLARSSVNSGVPMISIYRTCSSVSSHPTACRSDIACSSTRRWKRLDSPHRVATVAREPKPQRATKARNHSIDCIGQTATVTLMSRGEFE